MIFYTLLLVVGTTAPSLTSAMPQGQKPAVAEPIKTQLTNLCSGSPSTRSQCITEVESCVDFMSKNATKDEKSELDMEKICNHSLKNSNCTAVATICEQLSANVSNTEPQSLTSLDTLPTQENLETMCSYMEVQNCTETFRKCFDLIGPKANITGFPTPEMFECSKVFDTYIEVTKNISSIVGTFPTAEPDIVFGNDSHGGSLNSTNDGSAPTKQQIDTICRTLNIRNCPDRVEECFKLIGPSGPAPSSPTKEMIECSQFLSQFADIPDGPITSGTNDGFTGTADEEAGFTEEQIETMCRKSNDRNCPERVDKCFKLVGPNSPVPSSPTKEMVECSLFLQQFADTLDEPTSTTGTTEASVDTTTEKVTIPREAVVKMCRSSDEPNCVERFQNCFDLVGPGTNVPRTLTREMINCSRFLQNFSDAMEEFMGTSDANTTTTATTTTTTTTESTIRTRRPLRTTRRPTTTTKRPGQNRNETNSGLSTEEKIEGACDFLDVPNCANRIQECLRMRENKTSSRTENRNCSEVISSYEDIQKKLPVLIETQRGGCETTQCKRCETLLRPTRSFTSSQEECRTNTELTMKECMKPIMARHLSQVGNADIRRNVLKFYEECFAENSYGGITPCIVKKCAEVV